MQATSPDTIKLPHQSSVRIRLTDKSNPIFRVPSAAVKRENNTNYVWILDGDENTPTKSIVSVIAEAGEFAEITGNLNEDSVIVLNPPDLF